MVLIRLKEEEGGDMKLSVLDRIDSDGAYPYRLLRALALSTERNEQNYLTIRPRSSADRNLTHLKI